MLREKKCTSSDNESENKGQKDIRPCGKGHLRHPNAISDNKTASLWTEWKHDKT